MKKTIICKNLLLASLCFSFACMSCPDGGGEVLINYSIAEVQLYKDYSAYTIGNIAWSTKRGYQVAKFSISAKPITAWYARNGNTAIREMDSEDLGTTVPAIIQAAFYTSSYSKDTLWKIDEIELEHNYKATGLKKYYEMELQSLTNTNLKADLFFDGITGALLYSKEDIDDDNDDDRFVINNQLKAAVERIVPGAQIIDAEIDNNLIEVEIIVRGNGITEEIELKFSMNYVLISQEIEKQYIYSTLPTEFNSIKMWLSNHLGTAPIPPNNTKVEVTEGNQIEDEHNIGNHYYEVEIDEYASGTNKYEFKFYLTSDFSIIATVLNDSKQP